jgi:hypothetical protein
VSDAGTAAVLVDERDAGRPQGVCKRRFVCDREDWVRFAKNVASRLSPLLLRCLAKAHAWSTTVLVDELDARLLEGAPQLLTGVI